MSKRETPLGFVIALLVTFGLSAGGIWWAHQFGIGTHSELENHLETNNSLKSIPSPPQKTSTPASILSSSQPVQTQTPVNNTTLQSKPTPPATSVENSNTSFFSQDKPTPTATSVENSNTSFLSQDKPNPTATPVGNSNTSSLSQDKPTKKLQSQATANNLEAIVKTKVTNKPSSSTSTPDLVVSAKQAKTANALVKSPIEGQVKFVIDSPEITEEGKQILDRLAEEIQTNAVSGGVIRIHQHLGKTEFSQTLASQRGEEIAGHLRDKGLKNKIIISNKPSETYTKETRNKPVIVRLSF